MLEKMSKVYVAVMMFSLSAVDRVCRYRLEPRRNSSALDSWGPATRTQIDHGQDGREGEHGQRVRASRPARVGTTIAAATVCSVIRVTAEPASNPNVRSGTKDSVVRVT